jgi:hypothetical protein
MTETNITTWTVNEAPDGSPLANAAPSDIDMERADAVVRINASARRYAAEAVRADIATARRLAAAALANVYGDAAAWQHVRPGDLAPPPAAPQPERHDPDAITPADARWARLAEETLTAGLTLYPEEERAAARERLVSRALAANWSLRELGREMLRERAEAADRTHVSALHAPDQRDPIALALGQDDSASVWERVQRQPQPGEVTNASRLAGGGF